MSERACLTDTGYKQLVLEESELTRRDRIKTKEYQDFLACHPIPFMKLKMVQLFSSLFINQLVDQLVVSLLCSHSSGLDFAYVIG